ncbi:MAG: nitroreductase [Lachnospiraceae bacterium]|nr:nitroreductase [Lachnospiraceae bacterium]
MTELEAIYERHSVRNYLKKPIEPEKAELLEKVIASCNADGKLHLQFLADAGKTFGRLISRAMGLGSAPSVIACVGPEGPDLEEKIGYFGERVVLFAQTLGLNTCWAGTFSAKNVPCEIRPGERLVIVIAIGYGADQGRPHRSKTYDQVVTGDGPKPEDFDLGVELALLAPTAINQQRFEFRLSPDGSVDILDRKGPFSSVDLGIVKYHFDARKAR